MPGAVVHLDGNGAVPPSEQSAALRDKEKRRTPRARAPRASSARPPRPSSHSRARTRALLDEILFRPPPAPLIPAKPLDDAVSHAPRALRCAEIGPKTGPMIRRRRLSQPLANREIRAAAWVLRVELAGLEPAASWVRSRRSPALSLACLPGFRGGRGPVGGPHFRPVSAHLGWDWAKGTAFWPDLSA
jgi:hypothetical protein